MLRYLALIWDPEAERPSSLVEVLERLGRGDTPFTPAYAADGLIVFAACGQSASTEIYTMPLGAGVVVGKLFSAHSDQEAFQSPPHFSDAEAKAIIESGGKYLMEGFWGRYVAFIHDQSGRVVNVIRDPVGGLASFYTQQSGFQLCFSNASDVVDLGIARFSVNWSFVRAFVVDDALLTRATGLRDVYELLPGECLTSARGHVTGQTQAWDPVAASCGNRIENVDAAVAAVRTTTQRCVKAWVSCFPRLLHHLSGGLDSAVVLAALSGSLEQPQVTCINYFDASSEGDERKFARSTASSLGYELLEIERQVTHLDLASMLSMPLTVHPEGYIYRAGQGLSDQLIASDRRANAILGGIGGDQLFFHDCRMLAAADCMFSGEIGRIWRCAVDVARLEGCSVARVLQVAARMRFKDSGDTLLHDPFMYVRFASPELKAELKAQRVEQTINAAGRTVPPGKLFQIESLRRLPLAFDPLLDEGYELVQPLLSQPLIELALRIPTYLHVWGGEDRSIARRAFATELPLSVYRRRSKGGMTNFSVDVVRHNLRFLQDLLLDGELAKARLIDRAGLDHFLASDFDAFSNGVTEILYTLMRIEIWLRAWTGYRPELRTTPRFSAVPRDARTARNCDDSVVVHI